MNHDPLALKPVDTPGPDLPLEAFDYALLIAVGREPDGASPYLFEQLMNDGFGGFLGYSRSHCYKRIKSLASLGYLDAIPTDDAKRPKTVYVLTRRGWDAVRVWLRTPTTVPPLGDSELLVRIRAGKFVKADLILEGLRDLRLDLEDALGGLRETMRRAKLRGNDDPFTRLEIDLQRTIAAALLQFLGRVEDELGPIGDDRWDSAP